MSAIPLTDTPFTIAGRTLRCYVVDRLGGEVVVGATVEERGFDTTVTAGALYELLRDAGGLFPGVHELVVDEFAAGLRPATPDNAPVLGRSAEIDGLVWATGHHRNGILLAPVTAVAIEQLITTGAMPGAASHFGLRRFQEHSAAPAQIAGARR